MGAAYSVVVLIALAGDPSVVTVRIALSLTIGAFAPALLVLATVRRRNDLWILTATAVAVAVVAVAEWQLDRHVIPLYPGVIFDALERGDHLSHERPACSRCSSICRSICRTSSATHRLRQASASCRSPDSCASCRS